MSSNQLPWLISRITDCSQRFKRRVFSVQSLCFHIVPRIIFSLMTRSVYHPWWGGLLSETRWPFQNVSVLAPFRDSNRPNWTRLISTSASSGQAINWIKKSLAACCRGYERKQTWGWLKNSVFPNNVITNDLCSLVLAKQNAKDKHC